MKRVFVALLFAISTVSAQDTLATVNGEVGKVYTKNCATCHGPTLGGTGQGPSLRDPKYVHGTADSIVAASIRTGFPKKGMPGWKGALSEGTIRSLVILLKEQRAPNDMVGYARGRNEPKALPTETQHSEVHDYRIEVVTEGLDYPWSLAFLPDKTMLVTEGTGALRLIDSNGKLQPEPVRGTPSQCSQGDTARHGAGGYRDVMLHPNYANNGWIYLSYDCEGYADSTQDWVGALTVVRGHIKDGAWVDEQRLWHPSREVYSHVGGGSSSGRMIFGPDGMLYFTMGEIGEGDSADTHIRAQNLQYPKGKIHRVRDDGAIPADNPFYDTPGAMKSIWSYGHRVAQGLAFDPRTKEFWSTEHGPRGGDELNVVQRGKNYGWPLVSFGMHYEGTPISASPYRKGIKPPIHFWVPSIAVSTITFYRGDKFPKWQNDLFITSLKEQMLLRFTIRNDKVVHQERMFKNYGRLRYIKLGPDGYIYILLEPNDGGAKGGRLIRLVPAT